METESSTPPAPENSPVETSSDTNLWCMLCHLSPLLALIGIPFVNIIAPLLIWQIKKDEMPEVVRHGKESLNFQITATIAFTVLMIGLFVGMLLTMVFIGFLILPVVGLLMLGVTIAWVVLSIMAGVKANEGGFYDYPWTLRFVK